MKRKTKAIIVLFMCMFIVTTLITGCGQIANESAGTQAQPAVQSTGQNSTAQSATIAKQLDYVNLIMYLVGDAQPDADKVYAEVNKKLKQDINATVECKYLSWADYTTKYSLIFASGEDFDCIYTADWAYYADEATKGGFLEITKDMLQKDMPEYYSLVPPDFWDQLKINGKIYMVPYLNKQVEEFNPVLTRGDLREKYGLPEIKTLDDFDNYLSAVVKNEKGMLGYDGDILHLRDMIHNIYYKQPNNLMFLNIDPRVFTVALDDPTGKVNFTLDDPKYIDILKKTKEMADAGIWSKDVLANKTLLGDNFKAGKTAFDTNNAEGMITGYGDCITTHPEWKPEVTDLSPDKLHQSSSATRSGMGIHATSKNVERTLMMLNLFGTHKDYYDLTTYGIEGVHYTPVGDNKLKSTDAGLKLYPPKANCPWGWERKDFIRYPDNVPDSILNMESNWIKNGVASTTPVVSFNFVDTNVKNELAACDNIFKIRGYALIAGLTQDPVAEAAKLKADLKAAGIDKIQAEIQKQLTDYLNSIKD